MPGFSGNCMNSSREYSKLQMKRSLDWKFEEPDVSSYASSGFLGL
jgi:hypothetical protein